jgi:NADH:ubiquinone oxidoreductase subunit 5 (subunit L)/multisubunit Na+/H+ antiporter MnhA subunit
MVCAVVAILTSALTLASFIKFFGVSFLSRTSALVKAQVARNKTLEVSWMMQLPQIVLALFCILLGVVPAIGFSLAQRALEASRGGLGTTLANTSPLQASPLTGLGQIPAAARFAPLALAGVLAGMFLVAYGISKLGNAPRRAADPWLCGYVAEAECHHYVAHNFYGEVKRYFRWLGGAPHGQTGKPARWEGRP